jgi:FlaA1/EpsC-like NDP-sugar epimerase
MAEPGCTLGQRARIVRFVASLKHTAGEDRQPIHPVTMRTKIEFLLGVNRIAVWTAQIAIFGISALAAFLLRFDLVLPKHFLASLLWGLPVWIVVKSIVFRLFELDRGWWRYVCISDLFRLVLGNFVGTVVSAIAILLFVPVRMPRSIYALDFVMCLLGTAGTRLFVRILSESAPQTGPGTKKRKALIYGAGEAGILLLHEILKNPRLPYHVCGFVDDLPAKQGARISGITVLGCGEQMRSLAARHGIEVVLVAIPSATGGQMTRVLELCRAVGVECRTVPGLGEIIDGLALAGQIRDVAVEDLLGRSPVKLEEHQIRESITGKVILVTGAGGSIGSELCRQIARFQPAGIVGFECAESALFDIEQEMQLKFPELRFFAEIGSIQNRRRVDEVISHHLPAVIFHAAAYKHVPLMETHVFEAIENNVFGTWNVAMAAANYGVGDFVLISSDKAVRPTSLMGATKRVTELMLLEMQSRGTKYVAVRFGNVLGSNGSVISIFKRQIAAGGPVTVTHPEMRRFFMTIPEACQLVLQAAVIGGSGEICVLDMDKPVRIVDLARNLILLSGLGPDEDIRIEFTGIRPGEKMYEEVSSLEEDTVATAHEKIRIFTGNGYAHHNVASRLDLLREICESRDVGALVVALKEIVTDYSPSAHLLRRAVKGVAKSDRPDHLARAVVVPTNRR